MGKDERVSTWGPQKAAGQMLGIAPSLTLSDILDRVRQPHRIRGLKTIGGDEISYAKGRPQVRHRGYDLDRSCVVWVGPRHWRARPSTGSSCT